MVDLSIIILCYKSKGHLAVLLPSIYKSRGVAFDAPRLSSDAALAKSDAYRFSAEVIVVDNGSSDGTLEWLEEAGFLGRENQSGVKIIENINNGFAAGNNLGIRQSRGRYVLLLNPDTKLEPDTLQIMLDFMESRPDVGMGGCKLIKADGKLDLACRRRFPNPRNSFKRLFLRDNKDYNYSDIDENISMEVDSIVGAFMVVRKSVIDRIGLLDESFFMYGEDLDWCWRCKAAGFKVWYYPGTFITHYKGESSRKAPFKMLKAFHDAMWIFYRKHYAGRYSFVLNWAVWLGIYGRMSVLMLVNFVKKNPTVSAWLILGYGFRL